MWTRAAAMLAFLVVGMSAAAAPAPAVSVREVVAPAHESGGADGASNLDARCGDYRCDPPEDCRSCSQDCGDCCGNRRCDPPEDCNSCPQDCGRCPSRH